MLIETLVYIFAGVILGFILGGVLDAWMKKIAKEPLPKRKALFYPAELQARSDLARCATQFFLDADHCPPPASGAFVIGVHMDQCIQKAKMILDRADKAILEEVNRDCQ